MPRIEIDELQTMYNVVTSSILESMDHDHRVQQIAAGSALFAMKICKTFDIDARECALEIPYWIHRILNTPGEAFADLKIDNKVVSGRGETVRSKGMDYTPSDIIHKVIDPLFLDDLKQELEAIKTKEPPEFRAQMLMEFQEKLAAIKILDPACGSGNLLVESYICLRTLENEILGELVKLGVKFNVRPQRASG